MEILDPSLSPFPDECASAVVVVAVSLLLTTFMYRLSLPKHTWMVTHFTSNLKSALEEETTQSPGEAAELAIAFSLQYLSAKELTVMSCTCLSFDDLACQQTLWKALWRRRYDQILGSVPICLQHVDCEPVDSDPMLIFQSCLESLQMPPCLWIERPQKTYAENMSLLYHRFGIRKRWKLFYFGFGMHWQKWAVEQHAQTDDCWLIIHGIIYDMSAFASHPGGKEPFLTFAGFDATEAFEAIGHSALGVKIKGYFGCEDELVVHHLRLAQEGSILHRSFCSQQGEALTSWRTRCFNLFRSCSSRQ